MFVKAVLAAVLALTAGCVGAADLRMMRAVSLRLQFENAVCTGTAVAVNVVLTAEHCFEGGGRLIAINGEPAWALKIVRDGKDHALVRVTKRFKHWARMGRAPEQGDRVQWIGNPAGEADIFRRAYVTRVRSDEVWLDGQSFGGDSGAGMFSDDGRLIGVIYGGRRWATQQGFSFVMLVAQPLAFTAQQWKAIA